MPVVVAPFRTCRAANIAAVARVHDGLDVADRRGGQPHPGGEDRVAGLDGLRLLRAHGGPLHGLAGRAPLRLKRLAHRLRAADAFDRRHQPGLCPGGAGG